MATYGPGTKHNELTGGTYVYTKTQCDVELDKKQDKLSAGTGIALKTDGTISLAQLPKQEVNVLQTCQNPLKSTGNVCEFDVDHKLYLIEYAGLDNVQYKLAGCLVGLDYNVMAEVTLLVRLENVTPVVSFTADYPITYVGDTNFSVAEPFSTMWFAIRSFRNRLVVSKLATFES